MQNAIINHLITIFFPAYPPKPNIAGRKKIISNIAQPLKRSQEESQGRRVAGNGSPKTVGEVGKERSIILMLLALIL